MKKQKNGIVWLVSDRKSSVLRIKIPGGKKADITQYNIRSIPEGVIQNGIVYDSDTIEDVLKQQIDKVVSGEEEVGDVYLILSGDKVKSDYLYLEGFKPGELTQLDVQRIEAEFAAPITKLRFYPEEETTNGYMFHAVRHDIVSPYLSVLESLQLAPVSVLPIGSCLRESLEKVITYPTVVIYEKDGLHLFVATQNSVIMHNVWNVEGVTEENLKQSVKEAIKSSEDIAGIKPARVLVVESGNLKGEKVERLLDGMTITLAYFQPEGHESIDPIDLFATKGMLGRGLIDNEAGFGVNPIDFYELKVRSKEADLIKATADGPIKKDYKVAFLSTLVAALMLVAGLSLIWEFYLKREPGQDNQGNPAEQNEPQGDNLQSSETNQDNEEVMGVTNIEMELPEEEEEPVEEPEPEPEYTKEDVSVVILNGNGRVGEAKTVAKLLQDNGFKIEETDNADSFNYEETTILIPGDIENIGEEVKQLVSDQYPLAKITTNNGLEPLTVIVVLGKQ